MTEIPFERGANGFLVPPSFDGVARQAAAPEPQPAFEAARLAASPLLTRSVPPARPAVAPEAAGRLNWIFGALGIATGLASFVWPLVCLTVLVSLAPSAVGISRANRLRRRGANGRGIAIVALMIGLASAANLVFGFSSMFELQSQLSGLLDSAG